MTWLRDPGLHRSLFADNFSTMLSGFIGSVPTTTYGENIGVMAITGVYSVRVIGQQAAVLSIICSFVGPLAALIQTIPVRSSAASHSCCNGMIGTSGLHPVDNHCGLRKKPQHGAYLGHFVTGLSGITLSLATSPCPA